MNETDRPQNVNAEPPIRFFPNRPLLQPGLQAPLEVAANDKRAFRAVLRQILQHHRVTEVLVEPAAVTTSSILFGCQEIVAGAHDLLGAREGADIKHACERLVSACREISGNSGTLYVLQQASDEVRASAGKASDDGQDGDEWTSPCERLKNLAEPLERFFASSQIELSLALESLGQLEVHLDEIYDEASSVLELFYHAVVASPHPQPMARFFARAFRLLNTRTVPIHILTAPGASGPGAGDGARGLLDLLGELADSV